MKKRVLSLFLAFVLCLTLLPTSVFAEGADGSAAAGAQTEDNGQPANTGGGEQPNSETDTRAEIGCVGKPSLIQRGYDGTTDGSMIPINLTFTDGTNEIKLTEGTGFTAKKTFDSADAGNRTVTVEIELIGDAAAKYKLKEGEETFTIGGRIDKATPDLTVSLSKAACTVGEKILPLLSVEGAPEGAAVTYYYTPLDSGYSEFEGSEAVPAIDGNTAISVPGTYYVYAKTGGTKNYEEERSTTAELTVNEAVVEAASVTKADGTDGGTYESLPAALNAARDGDTVNLLENHTTHWSNVEAGEEQMAVVRTRITLDLNGNTVDYLVVGEVVSDEEGGILHSYDGNLTVKSSRSGSTAIAGQITTLRFVQGTLAVQDGVVIGSSAPSSRLICEENSGTVTISGGMVYNAKVGKGVVVTVNGGLLHEGQWINNGTLNITGGTFGRVKFYNNSGTIAISGGTFGSLQNLDNGSFQIAPISLLAPGHAFYDTYNENIVKDGSIKGDLQNVTVKEHTHTMVNSKCACGLSCTHTNAEGASTIGKDGKCTACGTQFTAIIGETYYADVPSALNAAADGQTVKLLANEMLPSDTYVSKTLTLDLNGHSLSGYSLNVGGLTYPNQVLTGKLMVIDSSGGNGAVGVAVRNGGTLVFNPENDNTTLLQLEVYGGTVALYGGKISRSGLRLNNGITLGNLLPGNAGLAYYRGDTQLTLAEAASQTCDLVVKSCSHGGKNGFDNNSAACPYCNAPAVAEAALNNGEGSSQQRRFANLQTAIDADRVGGAEFELLTDVTGDYTINGTQGTALDLNGHSIKGTVTVKGIKGDFITTTLSNTTNTTTASIDKVVAYDGAELAGSGKPAVIGELTLAEGATWKTILNGTALGYKVLNTDGTHQWYAPEDVTGSQLNNVIINSLPITSKTLYLKIGGKNLTGNSPKVERGTTVQLCASCNAKDVTVTFWVGKKDTNGRYDYVQLSGDKVTYQQINTNWYYVAEYIFNEIGEYNVYFRAEKDGYEVTSTDKTLKVTKPNLSNAEITFPYGNEAAFNYMTATGVPTFVVTYNGTELKENVDFVITRGDSFSGVGSQTLTIRATANGDYTGSKSAEWKVRPLKVEASVGNIIKTYDGTTALPESTKITLKSVDSYYTGVLLSLAKGTDYEVLNACYDSADASTEEKTVSFTIELKNEGYVFDDGTKEKAFTLKGSETDKTFKINKAAIASDTQLYQTVFNDLAKTYEIDLKQFLDTILPEGGKYGDIQYGQPSVNMDSAYYPAGGANIGNGKLSLSINKAASSKQGDEIGTVAVQVETTNYQTFTLTIHVSVQDKLVPVLAEGNTVSATDITYGQKLADSTLTATGSMICPRTKKAIPGTFAWKNGTVKPDASDSYEAEWTFTPAAGYEEYAPATGTVTVKVNKATPTFTAPTAQENLTYTGQEQALITAGSVVDYGTMQYSLTENGTYSQDIPAGTDAGAYTVWYRVIGDENHNDTAPASVAVRIGKKPLTITGVMAASKTYDGTKKADISSVTFDGVNWKQGTDYTVTASFDDASVGNGKNITATVTLMGQTAKNYALEQSSFPTTGSITKAAAPDFTKETALTIVNGHEKTYTVTLPALPTLETPKEYGALTYEIGEIKLNDGYYTSGAKVENGKLILPIQKNDVKTTGSVGTATVVIKSANYEDITLTVNVNATNKLVPTVTAPTANALTYNGAEQALVTAGKTTGGTMRYRLDDSEWSEQIPTAKNAGKYTVWYKVQGDAEYADVAEHSLTVTVAKKAGTVTALDKSAYTGSTAPDLSSPEADKNYKVEGLLGADTLSGTVTLTYAQTPDMSKTGKTAINIAGTLSNGNYEITYVPGTLTVSDRPSSGGGGSSSDRDTSGGGTVKTETTKNNDGSVTKTETKKDGTVIETTTGKDGSTVKTETKKDGSSVTESKDAAGSTGTVKTDKNGQTTAETALSSKAIEDSKRNGEPVTAPVQVEATRNSNTAPTVKIELPRNSGETKVEIPVSNVKPGTVAVLIHPDGTEEIVKNSLPTADGIQLTVNGGATVKIVDNSKDFADTRNHWAKDAIDFVSARGMVNGMSATIYAPNASNTRAQLWTILARQNNADLTGGATWFENAQNWAKAKGISDGANPNAAINRAQMVTMLYRAAGSPEVSITTTFTDVPADSYYAKAVDWAVENGITTGVGSGKFDPNGTCTRAQIAAFLARSMK